MNVPDGFSGPVPPLEEAVRTTLEAEGVVEGEVSVTLLGDPDMAELHGRYLGKSVPTDVLSFALHSPGDPPLGDVYVGHDTAARHAGEHGTTPGEELVRLAVHGVLHILGYDHPLEDRESSPMFQRQEALVRRVLLRPAGEDRDG